MSKVTDKEGRPIVFTYSHYNEACGTQYQYIPICPFCGGSHQHGGVGGIRVPHCPDKYKGDYHLYCLGEMPELVKIHFDKQYNNDQEDS